MSNQRKINDPNKKPQFVSSDSTAFPYEYALWLKEIKMRYRQIQAKAAISVNSEMLRFYWQCLWKNIGETG